MRRGIHIAISLVAVLLLLKPFDCFSGKFGPKAAACCKRGKCAPSRESDDCCKGTLPGGKQLVAERTLGHVSESLVFATTAVTPEVEPSFTVVTFVAVEYTTGSETHSNSVLPLRIMSHGRRI